MSRIRPLTADELSPASAETLAPLLAERGYLPNLYATLAHSPALLKAFIAMTAAIRHETALPADLRELAILAIARLSGAEIQWLAHLPLARAAGLSEATISGIDRGAELSDPGERAVVAFAQECWRDGRASEESWAAVSAFLDDRELVELTLTAGFYTLVSQFLLNAGVETDPEYRAAAQTDSSPT